jgi:hypothetical protein
MRHAHQMPSRLLAIGVISVTIAASVGCAAGRASLTPGRSVDAVAVEASPPASPGSLPHIGAGPSPSPVARDALIAMAVADAAEQVGAPASEVTVLRAEAREWPDRSLGCPKPGVGYAQVITPGLLIVVQVRGRSLEYHTDDDEVTLCQL